MSSQSYDFIYKGHQMTENEKSYMKKEWLNPNEVHNEYGFSISTLAKWRMTHKHLSFSKIGKYIKYKRDDIENFLLSHRITEVA